MAEKNLYYLNELSDYKVASDYPDVRGWEVKDTDSRTVGKVDNLLVNKRAKRVVYLDVEVDKSLLDDDYKPGGTPASEGVHEFINKEGENHLIVPIGLVRLDEDNNLVYSNEITRDIFRSAKRYSKGSTIDPEYEIIIFNHYLPKNELGNNANVDDEFYNRREFKRNK